MIRKLKRLRAWLPVIWNDHDYDHAFLLRIIEFKLRMMAQFHRSDRAVAALHLKVATQLEEAAALCNRMSEENYRSAPGADYDMKKEDAAYHRDLDRFCLLLKKYLRTWWD